MQNEHGLLELHGVDGTIRAASIVFDYLNDATTAKAFERFRCVMLITSLCKVQGVTEELPHGSRKRHQILFSAPNPAERFFFVGHTFIIHEQVYSAIAVDQAPQTPAAHVPPEVAGHASLKKLKRSKIFEELLILAGAGHIQVAQDETSTKAAKPRTDALNAHLMEKAIYSGDVNFLASPVIGGGVQVGRFQQLFLRSIKKGKKQPEEWAKDVWSILSAQGQRLVKEGNPIKSSEENLAALAKQAREFSEQRLPILKMLGVG